MPKAQSRSTELESIKFESRQVGEAVLPRSRQFFESSPDDPKMLLPLRITDRNKTADVKTMQFFFPGKLHIKITHRWKKCEYFPNTSYLYILRVFLNFSIWLNTCLSNSTTATLMFYIWAEMELALSWKEPMWEKRSTCMKPTHNKHGHHFIFRPKEVESHQSTKR